MHEQTLRYTDMQEQTGLIVSYAPEKDRTVTVKLFSKDGAQAGAATFPASRIDEAHILFTEAAELLRSRAALHEDREAIRERAQKLFALFRGERVSFRHDLSPDTKKPSGIFQANPGKVISIDVDGVSYQRLPVRTRLITERDTDILPILDEYVKPYLKSKDTLFVSEKALTITQGRVVDMGSVTPGPLARLLARNVSNAYGSSDFHGFGHGTALAMQLFIEEAGVARVLFAAAVGALTRPLGIKGMFYRICGKQAKSIDCPMSFLILEYAHSVKLAPKDPDGAARRIKAHLGCETVILDANYRGAFSLGKSTDAISESFIGKLFSDNPLGQSDEMTPFCIVRKTT